MPNPVVLAATFLSAAAVAAVMVLLFGWPWRRSDPVRSALGQALGIGLGVFVGCLVLGEPPHWPPREGQDRLLVILLPALVAIEILAAVARMPEWLAWTLRLLLAASAGRILLHGSVTLMPTDGESTKVLLVIGALAFLFSAAWMLLAWLSHQSTGPSVGLGLTLACACAAPAVMLTGNSSVGQMGMANAGAILGASLATLVLPVSQRTRPLSGLGVLLLFSLLVLARYFGDMSSMQALVLFLSPLLCWLIAIPRIAKLRVWASTILLLAAIAIPCGLVVGDAYRRHAKDMETNSDANDPDPELYKEYEK